MNILLLGEYSRLHNSLKEGFCFIAEIISGPFFPGRKKSIRAVSI
jgi:hypothetical protein